MEREGLHKVCKYSLEKGKDDPENPHRHEVRVHKNIKEDITDCIGMTPMVRMNNIARNDGLKCELCKFYSSFYHPYSGKVRIP